MSVKIYMDVHVKRAVTDLGARCANARGDDEFRRNHLRTNGQLAEGDGLRTRRDGGRGAGGRRCTAG